MSATSIQTFQSTVEIVGMAIDAVGVLVIVGGIFISVTYSVLSAAPSRDDRYTVCRRNLGRAILLGLELLVAGDIIRTVAVSPTLQNLAVLGAIVLLRTFLSLSLEMEVNGRWPWQHARGSRGIVAAKALQTACNKPPPAVRNHQNTSNDENLH